jgi:hypothetical protein
VGRGLAVAALSLALLQACGPGEKRKYGSATARTVVAIYTDVEGVSFSTDGLPYARFTDFIEREECLTFSRDEILKIIDGLEREGFFKEKNRHFSRTTRDTLPVQIRICVASPERSKEVMFLCEKGSNVPVRYREVFAKFPMGSHPQALQRWMKTSELVD